MAETRISVIVEVNAVGIWHQAVSRDRTGTSCAWEIDGCLTFIEMRGPRDTEGKIMNQAKRRLLLNALKLLDLTLMIGAFLLATILLVHAEKNTSFAQFMEMRVKISNCLLSAAIIAAWHGIFVACGVYDSKRLATRWQEISDSLKATNLSFACVLIAGKVLSIRMVTPRFLVYFWVISCTFMVVERILLRGFLSRIRRGGHNLRFILILGTNFRAMDFPAAN